MRHRPYAKYKPTGVDWLGEVPEHWEVLPLRRLAARTDEKGEVDEEGLPERYVGLEDIEPWTGRLKARDDAFVPVGISNRFAAGCTLFGKLRPYLAKACNVDFNGSCTSELLVLRTLGLDRRFFVYLLLTEGFISTVDSATYGAKMPRASWDFVGACPLPVPPMVEQHAIADFLDRETARIDELVAKKRALIEKLSEKRSALISQVVTRGLPPGAPHAAGLDPCPRLKPSGIEWLGDVPEHWELRPLYTRYSVELGKMLDEARITGDFPVPYVRNVDVQWDRINFEDLPEMDVMPPEMDRYTVRPGDLLVCEGGEVGRCAIVADKGGLVGYQKAVHRLRPLNAAEVPRYLFYTLRWASQRGVFLAEGNPNTIPHLTGEKLRRYRFPVPSLSEQRTISEHLDEEAGKIDQLVSKVEEAIARLQEYRAALTTAAVTGKIDIRTPGALPSATAGEAISSEPLYVSLPAMPQIPRGR